jgi:hypothetical protein
MPRANFTDLYVVCIHEKLPFFIAGRASKDEIRTAALVYRDHYNIPKDKMFTNRQRDTDVFTMVSANSLSKVTLNDKLYVLAHADRKEVGPYKARALAKKLSSWGLTAAGVITFKACDVGVKTFLEDFVAACSDKAIKVGWAKGYIGESTTETTIVGHPREGVELHKTKEFVYGHDARRVKVVKGNDKATTWDHWSFKVG